MSSEDLAVTLYAEDGVVVFGCEDDGAVVQFPLTPELADEIADRLRAAAAEARAQKPEAVQ